MSKIELIQLKAIIGDYEEYIKTHYEKNENKFYNQVLRYL